MNRYGIHFKEDLKPGWKDIKGKMCFQIDGKCLPKAFGDEITLGEFLDSYYNRVHTGVTRICEPFRIDFIASFDTANVWFSVCVTELFQDNPWDR